MTSMPTPDEDKKDEEKKQEISAAMVMEYLQNHRDFFNHQTALLSELAIAHDSGAAVSLIERQVAVLRDQNRRLRQQIRELVDVARENEALDNRMHRLILKLVRCPDIVTLIKAVQYSLLNDFRVDHVALRLLGTPRTEAGSFSNGFTASVFVKNAASEFAAFERLLMGTHPECGLATPRQLAYLFQEHSHAIQSSALVPLTSDRRMGIIGLGSCDKNRFHTHLGTAFLVKLAEMIAYCLRPHIRYE